MDDMGEDTRIGPVKILDSNQDRLDRARRRNQGADQFLAPVIAGRAVHCVVYRAQFRRLGQVEEIIEVNHSRRRHEPGFDSIARRRGPRSFIGARGYSQ